MKDIVIIGASSAIARACCRQWLTEAVGKDEPVSFFLVGRSAEKLEQTASDLLARGARSVVYHVADLSDTQSHGDLLDAVSRKLESIDVVLMAHGTLPDQGACERDASVALHEFENNATSFIALLTRLAHRLEFQGRGTMAVITSVAGDRGRPSNYLYGSAKAAVSTFCEGLRARLFRSGVNVIDIRPGFIDTPMTEDLDLPGMLLSSPERAAADIVRAVRRRRWVIYTPWYWRWIMQIIRHIPGRIFVRTRL